MRLNAMRQTAVFDGSALVVAMIILSGAAASISEPLRHEQAIEAGSYVAIAELCFPNTALTPQALTFAKMAKKQAPEQFQLGYMTEQHGKSLYDFNFCLEIVDRHYGPEGDLSKKLGFIVMTSP